MKQMQPKQLIAALGEFVETYHMDAGGRYQSLYAELLLQWQALNNLPMSWADERSRVMADKYWRGMNAWYAKFDQHREEARQIGLGLSSPMAFLYYGVAQDFAKQVMDQLPPVDLHQPVMKINDFPFRLHQQLAEFNQLDVEMLTMIDVQLLIEYWHVLADAVGKKSA